jgi:hypothetical protein
MFGWIQRIHPTNILFSSINIVGVIICAVWTTPLMSTIGAIWVGIHHADAMGIRSPCCDVLAFSLIGFVRLNTGGASTSS